jgi:hypothetical protein
MNGTPTSTSRRAIKHPRPKLLSPYLSSISFGSVRTLNAFICSLVSSSFVFLSTFWCSSAAEPRRSLINRLSSALKSFIRSIIRASGTLNCTSRICPLASTWNGAYAIPKKPGPSLAPPIETNGGISSSVA